MHRYVYLTKTHNTTICNKSGTIVVQKDEQGEKAVLWTGGETSETIEDRKLGGVTGHTNNEPAVMTDDGDTNAKFSAVINNSGSKENGRTEATQDLHQRAQVNTVRTINRIKPFSVDKFNSKPFFQMLCLSFATLIICNKRCSILKTLIEMYIVTALATLHAKNRLNQNVKIQQQEYQNRKV